MSRVPLLAGNWKMYKTVREAIDLVKDIAAGVETLRDREVLVCPPAVCLYPVGQALQGTTVRMGCQNMYWKDQGAFTGEISPVMARDVGCTYAIIGHSERRGHFLETDDHCRQKVQAALNHGLLPILCVGESLEEREAGKTQERVSHQVRGALSKIDSLSGDRVVVAYEPIWAIGTGRNDSPPEANRTCHMIRGVLADIMGEGEAQKVRILYGGSVKPDNIDAFMAQEDIDGALVGGASLTGPSFLRIVHYHV